MSKKTTIKDLEERINILAYNLNHIKMVADNIGLALTKYINFKGDTMEFKKDLENSEKIDKFKESKQNDLKNDEKWRNT